jgi:hypothetical protein
MSEVKNPVPSRKAFTINNQEKDLLISFSMQQRMMMLCGGADGIADLFTNQVRQTELMAMLLLGRASSGKTLEELEDALDALGLSGEESIPVLIWVQEYIVDFMLAQVKTMGEIYTLKKQKLEQEIQKVSTPTSTGTKG